MKQAVYVFLMYLEISAVMFLTEDVPAAYVKKYIWPIQVNVICAMILVYRMWKEQIYFAFLSHTGLTIGRRLCGRGGGSFRCRYTDVACSCLCCRT